MSRVQYQSPLRDRRTHDRGTSTSWVTTASMRAPWRQATCIAAQLESGVIVFGAEDDRHPLVNRPNHLVRLCSQDGIRLDGPAVRPFPILATTPPKGLQS